VRLSWVLLFTFLMLFFAMNTVIGFQEPRFYF
jgi:hypothetical protein